MFKEKKIENIKEVIYNLQKQFAYNDEMPLADFILAFEDYEQRLETLITMLNEDTF